MLVRLIQIYQDTKNIIETSHNRKNHLIAIIDFFNESEKLDFFPPHKSFILEFAPILIKIFKFSNINFIDPDYLISSKKILNYSLKIITDNTFLDEIVTIKDNINLQLLKMYFYLGEIEDGLSILKDILTESGINTYPISNKIDNESLRVENEYDKVSSKTTRSFSDNRYALAKKDLYSENRTFEILKEIKYEIERFSLFSDSEINIMLVEEDGYTNNFYGLLQELSCLTLPESKILTDKIELENIVDADDEHLNKSFEDILNAVKGILKRNGNAIRFEKIVFKLRFQNLKGIYKGASFGVGATILILCNYLKYNHHITSYKICNSAAFTGSIDGKGNLLPLHEDSIKAKVSSAFFSWIKYCVIPESNIQTATIIIEDLRKKYPKKEFNLIPVNNVGKIFNNSSIIKEKKENYYNYTKSFVKRNSIWSWSISSALFLIFGLLIAMRILPKDIKPLPNLVSSMYAIYSPDRDTNWIFKNRDFFGGDTINFGDVAIGDYWSPKIDFWNNSRNTENFTFELTGKDKDDFELLWGVEADQPNAPSIIVPDIIQRLFIKFRPVGSIGQKNAYLLLKNTNNEVTKTISLKGNAERYCGYSMKFENIDDQLVLDPKSNILGEDFTLSFWIKPLNNFKNSPENMYQVLADDNGSNSKFYLHIYEDSSVALHISARKSNYSSYLILKTNNKINFGQWNYIGISYFKGKSYLILNDEYISKYDSNIVIRPIEDLIYFGSNLHPSKREKQKPQGLNGSLLIDEFKIWNKSFNPDNIIKNRFVKFDGEESNLILYYDFDEANYSMVFDLTGDDYWSQLYGSIKRCLDNAPIENQVNENKISTENTSNNVLKLSKKGLMYSSKNLFKNSSSFTIQMDAKFENIDSTLNNRILFFNMQPEFNFMYNISYDTIHFDIANRITNYFIKTKAKFDMDKNWHRYTFMYSIENDNAELFIDGKLILYADSIKAKYDISRWFYVMSFGNYYFFFAPRYLGSTVCIDNIKIFDRVLNEVDIFSNNKIGLLANWTFDNYDKELVFDEINNTPAFLWENYEIIKDKIPY